MYSTEKLKELAIKQMLAAAELCEICENINAMLTNEENYDRCMIDVQRSFREELLAHKFGLTLSNEERKLWEDMTK